MIFFTFNKGFKDFKIHIFFDIKENRVMKKYAPLLKKKLPEFYCRLP
jgi:hypothetical protein